jgi:mono/diheme cytochrome c family protein
LSRHSALRALAGSLGALVLGTGCWEQWSVDWWPQMKWQKTVQAFEDTGVPGHPQGFSPPEGTLPVDAPVPTTMLSLAETEALVNPNPASLESLENGRAQFHTFCSACHGAQGHGDGPVAGVPFGKGPFIGVLPLAGPASVTRGLSDGHIFTTMTQGRGRMPSYRRIPPDDRWDIVNFVRYLNGQVNVQGGTQ